MVTIWQKSQPNTTISSRNVAIWYLLTLISLLYKDIRVFLQWIFLSRVLHGPGTIDEELFRFDLIRLFVREGIREKSQFVTFVTVLRCFR